MNYIEHIIEPQRLLLSWQAREGKDRKHYFVAELRRRGADDADLVYLSQSSDYVEAKAIGFSGEYPGFPADREVHTGVLAAFMRRLPPRQRGDFDKFLEAIRIPNVTISDIALLGYAGAKLPGDDFTIINPFDNAKPPFELLLLVAGYRHYQDKVPREAVKPGMAARFAFEPANPYDPEAVRINIPEVNEETAGYVCRGLLPQFRRWLSTGLNVQATVERLNGTEEHPLLYLFVTVRDGVQPHTTP